MENGNSNADEVTKNAVKFRHGRQIRNYILQWLQLLIGAIIASIGLELFLTLNLIWR